MFENKNMMYLGFDKETRANYEKNKITYNKQYSGVLKRSREDSKGESCLLCGSVCTSFCNSHSVPRFCLENIAADGHLLFSNAFIDMPFFKPEKGVNEAGTFNNICRDCDSKFFFDYENAENYNNLPTDKMLAQIAVKNSLKSISKRQQEIALYSVTEKMGAANPFQSQSVNSLDLQEYISDFNYAKKAANSRWNDNYYLVYHKTLDYVVPMAFQNNITLISDFDGGTVNNIYNMDPNYHTQDIHVCVFPLKNTSCVIAFIKQGDRRYRNFIRQIRKLNDLDALSAICYIILAYAEDVFFYKRLDSVLLQNEALQKVMRQTNIAALDSPFANPLEKAKNVYDLAARKDIPNLLAEAYKVR